MGMLSRISSKEYPSLTQEDIYACFDYGAALAEEQVTPLEALPAEL